jgi:hypothetical protein
MWQRFMLWCCKRNWHKHPYRYTTHDGITWRAICPRCGFEGMVDSQGNLF